MQNQTLTDRTKKLCPSMSGGNNFWPSSYSPKTKLLYIPAMTVLQRGDARPEPVATRRATGSGATFQHIERNETDMIVADPFTGEIKNKAAHPLSRTTAARSRPPAALVFTGFTDGTFAAYDDTTLEQLWKINVGTGFNAPPMTFEVGGKQYVAILSGLEPHLAAAARQLHAGAAGAAQPDHAVRVRAVGNTNRASRALTASGAQSDTVVRSVCRSIADGPRTSRPA